MTDQTEDTGDQNQAQDAEYDKSAAPIDPKKELDLLKQRADMIGVTYSNNIGVDTLRARIKEKLEGTTSEPEKEAEPAVTQAPSQAATQEQPAEAPAKVKRKTLRQTLIEENMRLIRVRITCMNPAKASLPGEVFATGNRYVGTVKKFIPFGKGTENGYHIPFILYKMLKRKEFQMVRTVRDRRTGVETPESTWQKEFAIEVLPALTEEELKKLAIAQMAAE